MDTIEQPRIWTSGPYRIVDHGGPGGLQFEARGRDAMGNEKWDNCAVESAGRIRIPFGLIAGLWHDLQSDMPRNRKGQSKRPEPEHDGLYPSAGDHDSEPRGTGRLLDEDAVLAERQRATKERLLRDRKLGLVHRR